MENVLTTTKSALFQHEHHHCYGDFSYKFSSKIAEHRSNCNLKLDESTGGCHFEDLHLLQELDVCIWQGCWQSYCSPVCSAIGMVVVDSTREGWRPTGDLLKTCCDAAKSRMAVGSTWGWLNLHLKTLAASLPPLHDQPFDQPGSAPAIDRVLCSPNDHSIGTASHHSPPTNQPLASNAIHCQPPSSTGLILRQVC